MAAQKSRWHANGAVDLGGLQVSLKRLDQVLNGPVLYEDDSFTLTGTVTINPGPLIVGTDPGSAALVRVNGDVRFGNAATSVNTSRLTLVGTTASSANLQQIAGGRIDNAFYDSAAAADEKYWAMSVDGVAGAQSFAFVMRSDAGVAGTQWLRAFRVANALLRLELASGAVGDVTIGTDPGGGQRFRVGGTSNLAGAATVSTGNVTLTTGNLVFGAASAKLIPGATSLSWRNAADSADNLVILDAGGAALRTTLTLPGPLTLTTAASKVIPGATSLSFRNTADSADNLLITNAGAVTFRSTVDGITTLTFTTAAVGPVFKSSSANPASGGSVRLSNNEAVKWRNASNSADFQFVLDPTDSFFVDAPLNLGGGSAQLQVAGTKVVAARRTGWTAWTGTAARGTQNADAPPTLTQVAQAVKALLDDLIAHGLIGA